MSEQFEIEQVHESDKGRSSSQKWCEQGNSSKRFNRMIELDDMGEERKAMRYRNCYLDFSERKRNARSKAEGGIR